MRWVFVGRRLEGRLVCVVVQELDEMGVTLSCQFLFYQHFLEFIFRFLFVLLIFN